MKILMTADTVGGVWTYALTLCRALENHGITIALATMGRPLSDMQRLQLSTLTNVTIFESGFRLCWMADAERDVELAGRWLTQLEQKWKPDLIHLNDLGHAALPWHSPVVLVAHSCVFSWWQAVRGETPPLKYWRNYYKRVQSGLANAQLLVAPTTAMLNDFQKHYGRAERSAVIANASEFPGMAIDPARSAKAESLVFASGRIWDEAKNLTMLAEVASALPWPTYIAGEPTDPNGGLREVPGAEYLGFLSAEEMESWLKRAAIYVAPAKYEPFGLAILEAARSGCALVLGDIPSLREVWGQTALYVDTYDAAALGEAINLLINQPSLRQQFASAAWRRAQQYRVEIMAAAYSLQYHALSQKKPINLQHIFNATAGAC